MTESRFEVLGRLGRGGTAEVLRVRTKDDNRQAALKRPLGDSSHPSVDFQKLAAREGHLIGGLRFPGLVRLLEFPGENPDYLLLELCEGPTLDSIGKITDLSLAVNILSAIALDVEFLRARGIIHGDLKPHNFFLPRDWQSLASGTLGYVKLSDFSLGRFEDEPESAREGLGTVGYMAPEMITDGISSHQSDLFALGVIFYQVLTGHHPFILQETDPLKINARVREDEPPPIERFRPDLPPAVTGLLNALLAKSSAHRPKTAFAVCQSLKEAGATYPYERALAPRYLVQKKENYEGAVARLLPQLGDKRQWLDSITNNECSKLCLILDENFRRRSLSYTGQGYWATEAYWPAHLRHRELTSFSSSSYSAKRKAVRAAIGQSPEAPSAQKTLLLPLLRPAFVRKLSSRPALEAERQGQYELATRLHLQSGNLEGADRCALQAATALRSNHQMSEAVRCVQTVLSFAEMQGKLPEIRSLLMLKGDILKEAGETDRAFATYQQLIDLYRTLPPDKLLAETHKDLGDLYKVKQDAKAGLESLQRALEIFQQLGEELEVSRTYNNIGNSYYYAGDVTRTIQQYHRALRIQRRLRAAVETASTLTNLGAIYALKGHLRRGIFLLRKSLDLKKDIGNLIEIARTLNNLGYAQHLAGQSDAAVATLQEALEVNRRIGNKGEILFNLENLTEVQLAAGFLHDSVGHLTEGLLLARERDDKPHQAHFLCALAVVSARMGRISNAETALQDLRELAALIDDPLIDSRIEVAAGEIRAEVGDFKGIEQHLRLAYDKALAAQFKPQQLTALLGLIRYVDDPSLVEKARLLARELNADNEQAQVDIYRTEYLLESDRVPEAIELVSSLSGVLDTLPDGLDTPHLLRVGAEAFAKAGQNELAIRYLSRARRLAQQSSLASEVVRILSLEGQIDCSNGHYEACYAKYRQALQLCKQIADTLRTDSDRGYFQSTRSVRFLVDEIRRLGKLLEKQRAG